MTSAIRNTTRMTAPAMPRTIPSVVVSLEVEENSGDASNVLEVVVVEVDTRAVEVVFHVVGEAVVVVVVVVISSVVDGVDDVDNVVVVLSWSPL